LSIEKVFKGKRELQKRKPPQSKGHEERAFCQLLGRGGTISPGIRGGGGGGGVGGVTYQ